MIESRDGTTTGSVEVIDQPSAEAPQKTAIHLLPHAFTSASAAEMQRKSVLARKQRQERIKAELALARQNPVVKQRNDESGREKLVAEQIVRTRKCLNGELEPRERAQLLLALDKLLERERILQGKPLPGSMRPTKASTARPTAIEPSE